MPGDVTDCIFQRKCTLGEQQQQQQHESGQETDVTVLELGGQRTIGTHHFSSYTELRRYFDLVQHHRDGDLEDPLSWDEPRPVSTSRPRSMKVFFFPSRCSSDHEETPSPFSKARPRQVAELLQEQTGLRLDSGCSQDASGRVDGGDEGPLSPSTASPPHGIVTVQTQQGSRSWETRHSYSQASTQTMADAHTTTYFCIDFPRSLQQRISDTLHSLDALARNPLFMDTLIVDEIIAFYRDAIKSHRAQLLATKDDDDDAAAAGTEASIRLEALAATWRTILRDMAGVQAHIQHLRELLSALSSSSGQGGGGFPRRHTRQKSSVDVFGPPAGEILQLQDSTCAFWARCVHLYLQRTTERMQRTSTYRLRKTIPLRRRGSLPQLNRRLSNFTIEVAVQFQRNSGSVSTLAISFLSTVFFSPDGLLFAITYWWWLLATLIVPLTFIIMHLWFETLASNTPFLRRLKPGGGRALAGVEEDEDDDDGRVAN